MRPRLIIDRSMLFAMLASFFAAGMFIGGVLTILLLLLGGHL